MYADRCHRHHHVVFTQHCCGCVSYTVFHWSGNSTILWFDDSEWQSTTWTTHSGSGLLMCNWSSIAYSCHSSQTPSTMPQAHSEYAQLRTMANNHPKLQKSLPWLISLTCILARLQLHINWLMHVISVISVLESSIHWYWGVGYHCCWWYRPNPTLNFTSLVLQATGLMVSVDSRWKRIQTDSVSHTWSETSFRTLTDNCIIWRRTQCGCVIVVSAVCCWTGSYSSTVCLHWVVWWRVISPVKGLVRRWVWWRGLLVCKKIKASHVISNARTVILTNTSLLLTDT